MKPSARSILLENGVGRMFLVFWLGAFALIAARIVFEITTAVQGSALILHAKSYDYILHVPPGMEEADHLYPLLIYLHGAGERNHDMRRLAKADLVSYAGPVARSNDFPFLVVCPKTDHLYWEPDRVVGLLDELLSDETLRWKIDPARIYLTGFSMGGFGTFSVAAEYPDRFAAIVPVAGGGDPKKADGFSSLPVWSFHGEQDEVVPVECTAEMMEALWFQYPNEKEKYRLTVYPEADHGIPIRVYRKPELYRWLLSHRKANSHSPD